MSIPLGILKKPLLIEAKLIGRYVTGCLTSLGLSVLISKLGVKIRETRCPSLDKKLYGHPTNSGTLCTWVL